MADRPKFHVSGSRIKLKASCTARNEGPEERGTKSKMEKRRIRRRFEMTKLKKEDV